MSSDNTDRIMQDLYNLLESWQPPTIFEQVDQWWSKFDKKWLEFDREWYDGLRQ
jgi:hypothetical protein